MLLQKLTYLLVCPGAHLYPPAPTYSSPHPTVRPGTYEHRPLPMDTSPLTGNPLHPLSVTTLPLPDELGELTKQIHVQIRKVFLPLFPP